MTVVLQVDYGNAEVRGQLRQWKKKLARDYANFDAACHRLQKSALALVAVDMVKSGRVGRQRAFEKISRALGPGVTLEAKLLDVKAVRAVWSILKPRESVTCDIPPDDQQRESLFQDCVTVNYFIAGSMPGMIGVAEGLWTLEVPDHALGRAVERSRFLHPGAIIREAHLNLLDLPATVLPDRPNFTNRKAPGVYVKAGPGCFVGHLLAGSDRSIGDRYSAHVRVRTWLSDDQLHADQIPLCEKAAAGERLGDCWLLPCPFRRIDEFGPNQLAVTAWKPRD